MGLRMTEYVVLPVYGIILTTQVLLLQVQLSHGNVFEGETQYLERGQQGVVACPALLAAGLTPSEVPVVYWYKGRITSDELIWKFNGKVGLGNGVPEGVYSISNNLGLIINQVKQSRAGTYHCRLSPQRGPNQDASVHIKVIVSPDPDEFQVFSPCDKKLIPSMCETSTDQSTINLTCKVENTFPSVELQMWSFPDGSNNMFQLKDAVINTERVTVSLQGNLTEREFLRTNNTFTRTASIEVEVGIEGTIIICNSSGPVPGKGKSTLVVIRKEVPVTPTIQTTSHVTTFSTGVTTTKKERTTSSIETGDDHRTRNTPSFVTVVLIVLTLVFAFSCFVSMFYSQRVTLLKDQWLQRDIKHQAEQPRQEQSMQMLDRSRSREIRSDAL